MSTADGRTMERRNEGTKGRFNSEGLCKSVIDRARGADKHVIDRARGGINPHLMDLRKKIKASLPGRESASRPPDGINECIKRGTPSCRPDRPAQGKDAVDFSRCIRSGDLSFW